MQISGAVSQGALDYATSASSTAKPGSVQESAQVLTLRKAIDMDKKLSLDLIKSITGVGSKLDVTG
mgnify:CR=1 FL=1